MRFLKLYILSLSGFSFLAASFLNAAREDPDKDKNEVSFTGPSTIIQLQRNVARWVELHKDNLRHLPRFPDFFVTFWILSPARPGISYFSTFNQGRAVKEESDGNKEVSMAAFTKVKKKRIQVAAMGIEVSSYLFQKSTNKEMIFGYER